MRRFHWEIVSLVQCQSKWFFVCSINLVTCALVCIYFNKSLKKYLAICHSKDKQVEFKKKYSKQGLVNNNEDSRNDVLRFQIIELCWNKVSLLRHSVFDDSSCSVTFPSSYLTDVFHDILNTATNFRQTYLTSSKTFYKMIESRFTENRTAQSGSFEITAAFSRLMPSYRSGINIIGSYIACQSESFYYGIITPD